MPVSLATGLAKVLFQTLVDNAGFPTASAIPPGLGDLIPFRKLVVIAAAVVRHTSKVTERCGISATGTEKGP